MMLNKQLAHSSLPYVRNQALDTVLHLFSASKGAKWVADPIKDLRILWQGLFFLFWHADKSLY